ncbi:MAG: LysM peptidoglycan-binding domain-containing protein [Candidatus Limnocylindrales bacterium]
MAVGNSLEHASLVAFADKSLSIPFATLVFSYNPSEVKTSRSATWKKPDGAMTDRPEYITSGPQKAQLSIFFDEWSNPDGDVSKQVNKLLSWTKPSRMSVDQHDRPRPPVVAFQWGQSGALANHKWCIESISAEYTMFRANGTPIRATCDLSLSEYSDDRPIAQNPSSGARESRRSRILGEGDSLASIAFGEFGDATLWRALARLNGIDDPMAIAPGTRILVPSAAEARLLNAAED